VTLSLTGGSRVRGCVTLLPPMGPGTGQTRSFLGYRYTEQMRTVQTIRYVLPLREGGSLPAIVEADDLGLYVVKFRGAGQGPLALVAELVAGEIGRMLGLNVPELVFAEVDRALGRNEPDAEIRHLLKASTGLNLALDYLPGSTTFDPAAGDRATPEIASLAVWFDAFVQNVDRNPRNPNLLMCIIRCTLSTTVRRCTSITTGGRRSRRWSRPSRPFSSMCCCRGRARLQTRRR